MQNAKTTSQGLRVIELGQLSGRPICWLWRWAILALRLLKSNRRAVTRFAIGAEVEDGTSLWWRSLAAQEVYFCQPEKSKRTRSC